MKIILIRDGYKISENYIDTKYKHKENEDAYIINKYSEKLYLLREDELNIGKNKDIEINAANITINMNTLIVIARTELFHNYRLKKGVLKIEVGDNLIIGLSIKIEIVNSKIIRVTNYYNTTKINLIDITKMDKKYKDYPIYTTSPRYVHEYNTDEITLELPPEKEKKNKISDLIKKLIPLFLSLIIVILMLKIRPRGMRGALMAVSALVSASITLVTLYTDRREAKEYNKHRNDTYRKYLEEKRYELKKALELEISIYEHSDFDSFDILDKIKNNSPRLYEREIKEDGFLRLKIGKCESTPKYKIVNPNDKLKLSYEDLELELNEVYDDYKINKNAIKTIDLFKNNVGIIGNLDISSKYLHDFIIQIIFNQTYHDVNLVFVTHADEVEDYKIYNKVLHTHNKENKTMNYCYDAATLEMTLNSYVQILRKRNDNTKEVIHIPHIVFVITNYDLIKMHPIMEFLLKDHNRLGFSLLVLDKEASHLPKVVTTVVEYITSNHGSLRLDNQKIVDIDITLDDVVEDKFEIEKNMGKLGRLNHIKGVRSNMPDKLGFLEMYDVVSPKELEISKRWDKNKSYESLSVLVGKKTQKDYVELNLHEKAHGPHGLLAGTTGSGKSEVIQTYILSLALNYSPEEIGFLLIDYKGGGMANLFKNMPHHLGSITNLDGYESLRALASIKSELKRRQKIFSDVDVNHINGYHKIYEKNKTIEAMPHLFLISDEFAELKSEQPEFMKELVSAARIGRSLGIHLILATQKPAGVVDEQIWSNSKFKLCLKVAEEADSKELLKTPDAAYIKNPGRGYLKVGNNEIYELFQSGYSGAEYIEKEEEELIDKKVYEINELGYKKLLNPEVEEKNKKEAEYNELEVVLDEIDQVYAQKNYKSIPRPWMPSLESKIVMDINILDLKEEIFDLKVNYGLIDLPHKQQQVELSHNFEEEGNIAIFGGSGVGKTTTIMTLALSVAMKNSPERVKLFVLDFGNSGLIQLKKLNHTAEYIKMEEELKVEKLIKLLKEEIKNRKILLEKEFVGNFSAYNKIVDRKIPAFIILLDNIDGVNELDGNILTDFTTILRDGNGLGIYFIISGNSTNSFKLNLLNLINQKIVLYLPESGAISTILGKTKYPLKEIQGRGQVKLTEPEVVQIYHPSKNTSEELIIEDLNKIINSINEQTKGIQNSGIKELKEEVKYIPKKSTIQNIYLGIEYEKIKEFNFELHQTLSIKGKMKSGKTNILKLLIEQLKENYKISLFDDIQKTLYEYSEDPNVMYIEKPQDLMYKADIFIFNKFDFFEDLDKKEAREIDSLMYKQYLRGKKFIGEFATGTKGTFDIVKLLSKSITMIHIDKLSTQGEMRTKNKILLQEKKEKYDIYFFEESTIKRIKPPLVKTKFKKVIKKEEKKNNFAIGGTEIELKSLVVGGKNSISIIGKLKEEYLELGYEIYNFKPKDTKKISEKYIIFIDCFEDIFNFDRNDRVKELDKLFEYSKTNIVVLHLKKELETSHEFIKKFRKPEYAIISDDLNKQKYVKIQNRKYKEQKVGENEAYYINEKNVKYIKL